jgi:hypothetical protein
VYPHASRALATVPQEDFAMQETVPTDTLARQKARNVICPLCWSLPGRCCSVSGQPTDHLARWVAASNAGQVSRAQLADVLARMEVIADFV